MSTNRRRISRTPNAFNWDANDRITGIQSRFLSGGASVKNLNSPDALTQDELRLSPDNHLYTSVAYGTFLLEENLNTRSRTETMNNEITVTDLGLDLTKGELDLTTNGLALLRSS